MGSSEVSSQEFVLRPELRRCCWYGIVAMPLLAGVMWGLGPAFGIKERGELAAATPAFFIGAVIFSIPLGWRVRIDDAGLTRRWLWLRETWPWDDFAAGKVEKHPGYKLKHTQRPLWRRWCSLGFLPDADRDAVLDSVNRYYATPEAPTIPDSLALRTGWKQITLDRNGVHLQDRKVCTSSLWSEVLAVDIEQEDGKRRDFRRMEIVLGERVLDFRVMQGTPGWTGSPPEVLRAYVESHVPADLVAVSYGTDRFASVGQWERRLAEAREQERTVQRLSLMIAIGFIVGLIWIAVTQPLLNALFMGFTMFMPFVPPYIFLNVESARRVRKLLELRPNI